MKLSFTFCNILLTYVYTHMQTHTEGEKERETFHGYVKKSIPELWKCTVRLLRRQLLAVSRTAHSLPDQKEKFIQFEAEMPPMEANLC